MNSIKYDYTATIDVPESTIHKIDSFLRRISPLPRSMYIDPHGDKDIIWSDTAHFVDGHEMDIRVLNGIPSPWAESVLFEHGCDEQQAEVRNERTIRGIWRMEAGNRRYTTTIIGITSAKNA